MLFATSFCPAMPALAQNDPLPAGFEARPLLKTSQTRDNEAIVYPTGSPEMISVIGTLGCGNRVVPNRFSTASSTGRGHPFR